MIFVFVFCLRLLLGFQSKHQSGCGRPGPASSRKAGLVAFTKKHLGSCSRILISYFLSG